MPTPPLANLHGRSGSVTRQLGIYPLAHGKQTSFLTRAEEIDISLGLLTHPVLLGTFAPPGYARFVGLD